MYNHNQDVGLSDYAAVMPKCPYGVPDHRLGVR